MAELESDGPSGASFMAELTSAEAEFETLRLTEVEAEKERVAAARVLEDIRGGLIRWERDLAVAAERAGAAERRLQQIELEREDAEARRETARVDAEALAASASKRDEELSAVLARVEESRAAAEAVRARLAEARERAEAVENRQHAAARRAAQLEGDREAAEAQGAELALHLERLQQEIHGTDTLVADLASQGDLFSDRVQTLAEEVAAAAAAADGLEERVRAARVALKEAVVADEEAQSRATSVAARVEALQRLESEQAGVAPAVQAAIEQTPTPILGRVLDFMSGPPELIGAVEAMLGPVAQGLVVSNSANAKKLLSWFSGVWDGSGGLYVLPLDRVPKVDRQGSLADRLEFSGKGADWARALLSDVELVDDGSLLTGEGVRLTAGGASVDHFGIVRIGTPHGGGGVLERRERLKALEDEARVDTRRGRGCRRRSAVRPVRIRCAGGRARGRTIGTPRGRGP